MKLTQTDVEKLKSILSVCKIIGVEGVVINEGMARGAKTSLDAAILTSADLSLPEDLSMGIGRVSELEKRINIFQGAVEIECKHNDENIMTMLTLTSGKTKVQYRTTSPKLMKYPKSNEDQPFAMITLSKAEVQLAAKAAKTLASENLVMQISRAGVVKLECADSSNDQFNIELEKEVEFIEEADSVVQTYLAGMFADVLDAACKDVEETTIVLGEAGSITATVKGHTLFLMPQISGEE